MGSAESADRETELELCKLRVEDHNRNYYSIREIEWRLVWEFLAGYAAVATAHFALSARYPRSIPILLAGVIIPILLLRTYRRLSKHIQDRLHYARDMKNAYLKKAHQVCKVPLLPDDDKKLPGAGTYAAEAQYDVQRGAAAAVVMCAVLVFITQVFFAPLPERSIIPILQHVGLWPHNQ